MSTIEQTLLRLQQSAFRAKFHLSEKDPNDGKQTPMRGHPVFIAQHACACCCRSCLNKWYHVPIGRELTEDEQKRIVRLLMAWIERQLATDAK